MDALKQLTNNLRQIRLDDYLESSLQSEQNRSCELSDPMFEDLIVLAHEPDVFDLTSKRCHSIYYTLLKLHFISVMAITHHQLALCKLTPLGYLFVSSCTNIKNMSDTVFKHFKHDDRKYLFMGDPLYNPVLFVAWALSAMLFIIFGFLCISPHSLIVICSPLILIAILLIGANLIASSNPYRTNSASITKHLYRICFLSVDPNYTTLAEPLRADITKLDLLHLIANHLDTYINGNSINELPNLIDHIMFCSDKETK